MPSYTSKDGVLTVNQASHDWLGSIPRGGTSLLRKESYIMTLGIVSFIKNGEEFAVNSKGYDEIECDIANSIIAFPSNKHTRYIGIQGNLYRLTMKSYKELKKYLQKTNKYN